MEVNDMVDKFMFIKPYKRTSPLLMMIICINVFYLSILLGSPIILFLSTLYVALFLVCMEVRKRLIYINSKIYNISAKIDTMENDTDLYKEMLGQFLKITEEIVKFRNNHSEWTFLNKSKSKLENFDRIISNKINGRKTK